MAHIYERELTVANGNALTVPAGYQRKLFPIGFPPTGRILHLAVRETTGTLTAFIARLYDRDIGFYIPVTAYVPAGASVTYAPAAMQAPYTQGQASPQTLGAYATYTYPTSAAFTLGKPVQGRAALVGSNAYLGANKSSITSTYATAAALLGTTNGFYADVVWSYGGMSPLYNNGINVAPAVSFGAVSVQTATGTPASGVNLPIDNSFYNAGSMYVYYLPPVSAVSNTPNQAATVIRPAIIIDEFSTGEDSGSNLLKVTAGGTTAWFSDGYGRAYMNREGSFSVPVRQIYLDIDFEGTVVPSGGYTFEVDIACDISNEAN